MEIKEVIGNLKDKFGDTFDEKKVTELFKGVDLKNFSMKEVIDKVKNAGILGDLDGDGVKEGFFTEVKDAVGNFFKK